MKHLKPWIFEEEKTESKTETRPNAEDNTNNLVPNPTLDEGENEAEEIVDRDMKQKSKSRIHENDDSEIAFADNTNVTGFCEDDSMLPNQEQFEHNLKSYPEMNAQSLPIVSRTEPKKEDEGIIVSQTNDEDNGEAYAFKVSSSFVTRWQVISIEDDDPSVHLRPSDKALRKQELPPNAGKNCLPS
eukprot:gene4045-20218_t